MYHVTFGIICSEVFNMLDTKNLRAILKTYFSNGTQNFIQHLFYYTLFEFNVFFFEYVHKIAMK